MFTPCDKSISITNPIILYQSSMLQQSLEDISTSLHPMSFYLPWQIAFHTLLSIRSIGGWAGKLQYPRMDSLSLKNKVLLLSGYLELQSNPS